MASPIPVEPALLQQLQAVSLGRHLSRIALFAALYAGAAGAAWWLAEGGPQGPAGWLLRLPLYLLAAGSLHGISLFTHEGVHGSLARSRWLNHALSALCAWPVLQNFAAYRVLHLKHHGDLGGPQDPDHYANYTGRPRLEAAMHWGRLLLGYPAYVSAIPFLGWRRGTALDRLWLSLESLALLGLALAAWSFVPHSLLLHGWLVPMVLINTLVNIRGMSQHTGLAEPSSPVRGSRTFLTNPVVEFFMCSENFHLEHHLFPRVPWYSLRALSLALRPQLEAERAPFTPGYLAFVRDFVSGRFRSAR